MRTLTLAALAASLFIALASSSEAKSVEKMPVSVGVHQSVELAARRHVQRRAARRQALQRRQNVNQYVGAAGCDFSNDGRQHCGVGAPGYSIPAVDQIRPKSTKTGKTATKSRPTAVDANANPVKQVDQEMPLTRNGMVRVKTAQGFYITVHPAYASKFQRFFAALKAKGYHVNPNLVGCYSPGHKPGSNHRIGAACDIQTGWNRGPAFVYHMGDIIRAAGLHDGCAFGDCGHVEAVRGLYNRAPNLYASVEKFKTERKAAAAEAAAIP